MDVSLPLHGYVSSSSQPSVHSNILFIWLKITISVRVRDIFCFASFSSQFKTQLLQLKYNQYSLIYSFEKALATR